MAVPSAPTNVLTLPDDGEVLVTWKAPAGSVTNYIVDYSINGSDWTEFADDITVTSVSVTSLSNEQPYFFRVRAENIDGQGANSSVVNATPSTEEAPTYCQPSDVADWLRIDINGNTDPNTKMVRRFIVMNEERIDRLTGHSWRENRSYTEVIDITDVYDWGWGMYAPLKHRNIKSFDPDLGDKLEIYTGTSYEEQVISDDDDSLINFEPLKGIMYVRGFIYTLLRKHRLRITYRYGGDREGATVPKDIKKCAILMTAIDMLSTDFKMSQLTYGGEGNIDKLAIMSKWEAEIKNIIWSRSEILCVF